MPPADFPTRIAAEAPLQLLGGLTPAQFMRRHWQKKPLLIRAALPSFAPLSRAALFALARNDAVESRRIVRRPGGRWTLEHGPFKRSTHPSLDRPGWTLVVQGVELHDDDAHALLRSFRFIHPTFMEGAPLNILKRFTAEREFVALQACGCHESFRVEQPRKAALRDRNGHGAARHTRHHVRSKIQKVML